MDKRRKRRNTRGRRRRRRNTNLSLAVILGIAVIVLVCVAVAVGNKGKDKKQETTLASLENTSASDNSTEEQTNGTGGSEAASESGNNDKSEAENSNSDKTEATQNNSDNSVQVTSKGFSIQLINGITYVDGVLIANKTYALPEDYAPGDLDSEVKAAFDKMQAAAAKEGLNLYISSGYRSYTRQQTLYNNYVSKDGKALADTYSARAGHSEHQSGLCFDLNTIDDSFAYTAESKWLEKHAQEYGFIIRYPKGKEEQTGYQYEPWHLRYLGVELATKVYESGLCLEEYYGITSEYSE